MAATVLFPAARHMLAGFGLARSSTLRGVPINGATRTVPLGFESETRFLTAAQELNALESSGIDDAVIGVRGSSVTGKSYYTSTTIPGFVNPKPILRDYPLLNDWSAHWDQELGRKITPGAFQSGTVPNHPAIIVK